MILRLVLASLALTSAAFASSEGTAAATDSRPANVRAGSFFAALDRDPDGRLSLAELDFAPLALRAVDLDEDGRVTAREFLPSRPAGAATLLPVSTRVRLVSEAFLVLDANGDGVLQELELANASSSLRRLDANADGFLTPAELRPRWRA